MRFMMIMYPGQKAEQIGDKPELGMEGIQQMMKYNEDLAKAGVLLALDGLMPSAKGSRVRVVNGKKTVTDGPFTEAKEIVGGYWLIQVRSREEAKEWASRVPLQDGEFVELRQIWEISDFGPEAEKLAEPVAAHLKK